MSNSSKRDITEFPLEFGAFLPPDIRDFLSAKAAAVSSGFPDPSLLSLEPRPPAPSSSDPAHSATHQSSGSQHAAAGTALLSESQACALLSVSVSRGRFRIAKELVQGWHWRLLTELRLEGHGRSHDVAGILACFRVLRDSDVFTSLSVFEARNYESSSFGPGSAIAILKNLPVERSRMRCLKLQQFAVSDEVIEFCCQQFPSLTCLDVSNNEMVYNVPPAMQFLTCLTTLNVSNCMNLVSLPDELLKLRSTLATVSCQGCGSIKFPPASICMKGKDEMLKFLSVAESAKPLRRVKVMFLGNGRCGKTSLIRALAHEPLKAGDAGPDSTIGVSMDTLKKKLKPKLLEQLFERLPEITYWDFAGQLEYSAAHDFFLSSRQAVYVIVFSVVDDRDSQIHQVAYWLRTVSTRASQHVRFIIVGTKVDKLSGSDKEVEARLESIRADIRNVVATCCGGASLESTSFQFVTSLNGWKGFSSYDRLRRGFKKCLKGMCKSIFQGDPLLLKTLRFPEEYRHFQQDIHNLSRLRPGLPILELESVHGQEYGRLQGAHMNAQSLQALKVLHDVGDIVFCHISDGSRGSKACLCWKPQVIADVIATFADPESSLPIWRGCSSRNNLEGVLEQYLRCSPYSSSSDQKLKADAKMLFNFLFALRVFTTIERRVSVGAALPADDCVDLDGDSIDYMVPASLQGRPSFWREVFSDQGLSFSCIRGTRYSCMDSMITVAAFVRAMTQLCSNPARMWGCAFSFPVSNGAFIFVRLAEGRGFVDVVVLGTDLSQLVGDCVENSCLEIAMHLRCSTSNTFLLCPHCCASDVFPRSGAAHAFHKQQLVVADSVDQRQDTLPLASDLLEPATSDPSAVDRLGVRGAHSHFTSGMPISGGAGSSRMISCSRYHEVDECCVHLGQHVGSVGGSGMPVSFPASEQVGRDSLDWVSVSDTGLAVVDAGKVAVMPNSFFSLTRQLSPGDILSEDALVVIRDALESGAKTCCVQRYDSAGSGALYHVEICLEYLVGDSIGSHVIDTILSCSGAIEIKTAIAEQGSVITKKPHNLSCGDKVLLSVSKDCDGRKVDGVFCLVTDVIKDDHLILARAPAPTLSGSEAWTEWDASPAAELHSSHLPLSADASFLPARASFTPKDDVIVLYKRPDASQRGRPPFEVFPGSSNHLRIARLQPSDCSRDAEAACWRDVEDNWAIMLGSEFHNYEITRITMFRCEERERLFLDELHHLKRIAPTRSPAVFDCVLDKNGTERARRAALQQQIMGHFRDFSQKFCLLPSSEGKDVNLCVAWWGKWSSVYHNVAQNGFSELPPHLKLDPGFFGDGFYLTRYPRYSDYYINGCSLSTRKMEHGSILMCYAALGRPYPVTQDPFKAPNYSSIDPQSLCGKPCGAACGFSSHDGVDSHDCHYVTVKLHSESNQYFPCPARQQPDYDEIVLFNPNRILASAYVDFQRRRKTLLWLDDNPTDAVNTKIRLGIPGHGNTRTLEGLNEGRLALKPDNLDNFGISLEDQVDVTLFTTVDALDAYLCHPNQRKFIKYPTSLFRIVTNRRLYVGPDGLLPRLRRNAFWCSAFPATLVFHGALRDGLDEVVGLPNLLTSRSESVCQSFVSFRSAELLVRRANDAPLVHRISMDEVDSSHAAPHTSTSIRAEAETAQQVSQARTLPELCRGLKESKFDSFDLKLCGFEAPTLRLAGFDAATLKLGGYDYFTLKLAGFAAEELRDAGFVSEIESQAAAVQYIAGRPDIYAAVQSGDLELCRNHILADSVSDHDEAVKLFSKCFSNSY